MRYNIQVQYSNKPFNNQEKYTNNVKLPKVKLNLLQELVNI
jgi:hypothetical protein